MMMRVCAIGMIVTILGSAAMCGEAAPVPPQPADQKAAPKAPEAAPQAGTLKPDVATTETTQTDSPTAEPAAQ